MSSSSCSSAPMPFVTGGGPIAYPPAVQTVQAPMADPYLQAAQQYYQSPIPAQPDVMGGGTMSPMQVPIAQQPQFIAPQPTFYAPQPTPYAPQPTTYAPQQQFVPQQQYIPQQALIPQQYVPQTQYVAPQQQYVAPQTLTPQAPATAQASAGQTALGGGPTGMPGAGDMSGMIGGLQQAVASMLQTVTALTSQLAQRSPVNGGGPSGATGGGAAGCCGGGSSGGCGGSCGGGGGSSSSAPPKVSGGGADTSTARSSDGVELPPIPTALTPRSSSSSRTSTSTEPTAVPSPPPAPTPAKDELPPVPPASGPAPTGSRLLSGAPLKVKGKEISEEQRKNLQAVLEVGKEMGADRKTMVAAVATVIQESVAQNLDYGDRDSLGLFQQRPSQGWGTPEQVRDPKYAARKFFDQAIPANKENPNFAITELAQKVQRSGLPDAYAQWEGEANAIVDAFGA